MGNNLPKGYTIETPEKNNININKTIQNEDKKPKKKAKAVKNNKISHYLI